MARRVIGRNIAATFGSPLVSHPFHIVCARMTATLTGLVDVHSAATDAMIQYLAELEEELSRNPLLARVGRRLDDLRLPLQVVPYVPTDDLDALRARENLRSLASDEPDHLRQSRLYESRGDLEAQEARGIRPESLDPLAEKLRVTILLGDPGSGKTEWLKQRARRAARELRRGLEEHRVEREDLPFPVFVSLPDVAREYSHERRLGKFLTRLRCNLGAAPGLPVETRAAAAILKALVERNVPALPAILIPWVWRRLNQGETRASSRWVTETSISMSPVLLCLDALDEVRGETSGLRESLRAFAQKSSAQIAMTSRIIGYQAGLLVAGAKRVSGGPRSVSEESAQELRLCAFTAPDTHIFIRGFFAVAPAVGEQLIGELERKASVAGMAQNPLLATLLCLAFSTTGDVSPLSLPARRSDVYERVVRGLLGTWPSVDKGTTAGERSALIEHRIDLCSALAAHVFPSEVVTRKALDDFLWKDDGAGNPRSGYLKRLPPTHPLMQRVESTGRTVDAELQEDGILVPCGGTDHESFRFLHLTLSEYFVARSLADEPWESLRARVDCWVWDPAWHEVLVLLTGRLPDPLPMLVHLADEAHDDVFRHRLAMAGLGVTELSGNSDESMHLARTIAAKVFEFWLDLLRIVPVDSMWKLTLSVAALGVTDFTRRSNARGIMQPVLGANTDEGVHPIRHRLAELLRAADRFTLEVVVVVFHMIGAAAVTDATHGHAVLTALLSRLLESPPFERKVVAEAVNAIGAEGIHVVLATLRSMLESSDGRTRFRAILAVGAIGTAAVTDPTHGRAVLAVLLSTLQASDDPRRRAAAEAVGSIGAAAVTDPAHGRDVLAALLSMLESSDPSSQKAAAEAIGSIGAAMVTDPTYGRDVLAPLLSMLKSEPQAQRVAASAISRIGASAVTDPTRGRAVLAALRSMLKSSDPNAQGAAALAISHIGVAAVTDDTTGRAALAALLSMLGSSAFFAQFGAQRAIESISAAVMTDTTYAHDMLAALLSMLESSDPSSQKAAAEAIGSIGAAMVADPTHGRDVLAALLSMLKSSEPETQRVAAEAIGASAVTDPTHKRDVLAALLVMLESSNLGAQRVAARTIQAMGATTATDPTHGPDVLAALLSMLKSSDPRTQQAAAWTLTSIGAAALTDTTYRRSVLAALLSILESSNHDAQLAAAGTIQAMGAADRADEMKPICHAIAELLDRDDHSRNAAIAVMAWVQKSGLRFFRDQRHLRVRMLDELVSPSNATSLLEFKSSLAL